jgi:hypothetical protein
VSLALPAARTAIAGTPGTRVAGTGRTAVTGTVRPVAVTTLAVTMSALTLTLAVAPLGGTALLAGAAVSRTGRTRSAAADAERVVAHPRGARTRLR